MILFFVVAIIINVFTSTTPIVTREKKSDLAFVQHEARADGPEDPTDDFPPTRVPRDSFFLQSLNFHQIEK